MSNQLPNLDAYWMPFTGNRDYKKNPRMVVSADGHHYISSDGRKLYDGFSGLWTSGLGHCHPKIVDAVQKQVKLASNKSTKARSSKKKSSSNKVKYSYCITHRHSNYDSMPSDITNLNHTAISEQGRIKEQKVRV